MKQLMIVVFLVCMLSGCATSPQDAKLHRLVDTLVIPEADFHQADVHDVAAFYSRIFKPAERVNVVLSVGKTVVPPITLAFSDLTLRQALNVTCNISGLNWEIRDGVIMIETKEVQQKH